MAAALLAIWFFLLRSPPAHRGRAFDGPAGTIHAGERPQDALRAAVPQIFMPLVNAGIKMYRLAGVKMHHGPDATTAVFSGTGKPGA